MICMVCMYVYAHCEVVVAYLNIGYTLDSR